MKPESASQLSTEFKIIRTKGGEMYENEVVPPITCGNDDRGAIQKTTNHENNSVRCDDHIDSFKNTVELANDLKEAFQQCQHIVTKLHRRKETSIKKQKADEDAEHLRKKIEALIEENRQLKQLRKSEELTAGQTELSNDQKKEAIVAENVRLRMLLKDVTEVNKRWQKYNHDRQEYVQHLLSTIREMEQKLSQKNSSPSIESEPRFVSNQNEPWSSTRHSDSDLLDYSGELTMLRLSYERAVKENSSLQKDLDDARTNLNALAHQLELTAKQSKEHVELLEMQVKMFKEDFDAECKEKVAAHKKISELNEEIASLQSIISSKESGPSCLGQQKSPFPTSSNSHVQIMNTGLVVPQLLSRGCFVINANALPDGLSPKETATQPKVPELPPSDSWEPLEISGSSTDDKNIVHCPECKMVFPTNHHHKFLDHFKECQKHNSF